MSEHRHDSLELIRQTENRGRQVYGMGTSQPGAEPFGDTRPMQHWMPGRKRMSVSGAVLLLATAAFSLWGIASAGTLVLRWLGW